MTVEEVISLLTDCTSKHDELLMRKSISSIEVLRDDRILLCFTDGSLLLLEKQDVSMNN